MKNILLIIGIGVFLSACSRMQTAYVIPSRTLEAVGYSSLSQFDKYPLAQRRLLAIRGAKLDAYRNLAEQLYGVRIRSHTTVKDMVIKNDSYRAYLDAMVRGAQVQTITPKDDGVYEVEVRLTISDEFYQCLKTDADCGFSATQQEDNSLF